MQANETYKCHVESYGLKETKNGFMQVWVKLYNKDDHSDTIYWRGTIKPGKAQEIAFKALKVMGFNGDLEALNSGAESGCLDVNKEVAVVTQAHEWEGKTTVQAQWINEPGGAGVGMKPEKVHIEKAKFNSAWKTFEAEEASKNKLPPQVPEAKQAAVDVSDIPF